KWSPILVGMAVPILTELQPDTISFIAKEGPQRGFFDVINRGGMIQMYKVKTNNGKGYKIKPVYFSLQREEKQRVSVAFAGLQPGDQPPKDRITVVYAYHTDTSIPIDKSFDIIAKTTTAFEHRKYVKVLFKEDRKAKKSPGERSFMQKSVSLKPDASSSSLMVSVPRDQLPVKTKKRDPGISDQSDETADEPQPPPPARDGMRSSSSGSKKKKAAAASSNEATEEGGQAPAPVPTPKPRLRRKVAAVAPPSSDGDEVPAPSPQVKPRSRKKSVRPAPPPEDEGAEEAPATAPVRPAR
ncbi:hypothetical protein PFISCL1PPCAC_21977, partial [Pristionchus fissidentatus]